MQWRLRSCRWRRLPRGSETAEGTLTLLQRFLTHNTFLLAGSLSTYAHNEAEWRVSADVSIDRPQVTAQQVFRPMSQFCFLTRSRRFGPHVCPGNCLADSLGIRGVALLSLDVRLYVGCRHQVHRIPAAVPATNNVMRRKFRCQSGTAAAYGKTRGRSALQLTANDHFASTINAVHLKDRFGDVEPTGDRLYLAPPNRGSSSNSHFSGTHVLRSRPQHQKATRQSCYLQRSNLGSVSI
jgi:hypothetical protein